MNDPIRNIAPEMRERYLKACEEMDRFTKMEEELDTLIRELERQKKDTFSNPHHAEYAYVTYEDLENLPIWNKNQNEGTCDGNSDEQSLVIAI